MHEVSCTELWLHLSLENIPLPQEINLVCDSPKYSSAHSITSLDTTLYLNNFNPGMNYRFHVKTSLGIKSNYVTVSTLDTTTHEISWQIYEFGDPGIASKVNDIFIFNESNIYAVGEIFLNDSVGIIDTEPYGLIVWDGTDWRISRIEIKYFNITASLVSEGLAVFDENNIWYASGNIFYWNGDSIQSFLLRKDASNPNGLFEWDQVLNSIWGSNNSNIYSAGYGGAMAWFDGQQWNKLNTMTNEYLSDIYGVYNHISQSYEIYSPLVIQYYPLVGSYYRIINSNKLTKYDFDYGRIFSIWGTSNYNVFACGTSIHRLENNKWQEIVFDNTYSKIKMRGSSLNNIFVVGGYGFVGHFNGLTWNQYPELRLQAGNYTSLFVKDNIVAICGFNGHKGVIAVGILN